MHGRAQQTAETFTNYIEDVLDLCHRVNTSMTEIDKIKHIMKGTHERAFQMLLAKYPRTVIDVVMLCQSYDELQRQRIATRHPEGTIAGLSDITDSSALLQKIKDFVREEIARQLSLLPSLPCR